MVRHLIGGMVLLCGLASGCSSKASADRPVVIVDSNDSKMNAAIDQARETVPAFITALKKPRPGQVSFAIKMAFVDGKQTEHIWISPVQYDGKVFRGKINNTPELVKNVTIGQSITVEPKKISDWMYINQGKLVGGTTVRVLRDNLSASERKEFDQSVPFKID